VYRGGSAKRNYPNSDFRAFLDSLARSNTSTKCKNVPATAASPGIKSSRRTTKATRLDCTLPAKTSVMTINAAGSADLRIRQGSKLLVDIHMAPQGSRMLYDGSKCKPGKPPA
jgi:hypothetical protein